MSVCVSAILSHPWESFLREKIEEIAHVVSGETTPVKWSLSSSFKSVEEQFAAEKTVLAFLPEGFTIWFGKKFLILGHANRWSTFLVNEEARQHFLRACREVSRMCDANELLLLPEGTVLDDLYYNGAEFEEVKRAANQKWGPPDLDIDRIYTEDEIYQDVGKRVHYFLISAASVFHLCKSVTK